MRRRLFLVISLALVFAMGVTMLPVTAVANVASDAIHSSQSSSFTDEPEVKQPNDYGDQTQPLLDMPYTSSASYRNSIYYSRLCNVSLTGDQRVDIVNVAASQIGYHEGNNTSELDGNNINGTGNYTEYGYWFGTEVKRNPYGHFY